MAENYTCEATNAEIRKKENSKYYRTNGIPFSKSSYIMASFKGIAWNCGGLKDTAVSRKKHYILKLCSKMILM